MTELLIAPEKEQIAADGCTKTAYDMAMGTSQMLGCLTERLQDVSKDATLTCFGQEFKPETYAIAKADMLIKGGNASGMKYGDTLSDDAFGGYEFDYMISNPPFGIDWKREKSQVEAEAKRGYDGRFDPGLPAISDGQMLFMLNGVKKLKEGSGRMAIIQNGSSLFTGDAGSGASEIRRYLIHEDLVEAIVQLPTDLFYNTGISTYIWVLTKGKPMSRSGRVQLIPASWKTIRVKQLLRERKERSVNGKEEPLSMSQKVGLVPTKMLDMIPNMASSFVGAKLAYVDDLVFNKLKAHLGVFSVSKYDGLVSPDYAVYYSTGIIDLKYLEYLFKTPQCISEFRKRSTGIAAGLTRLYTDGLFAIECPMPSKDEQAEIVLFLNEKCAQIDELMSLKQTEIEKLEQYKRSLIYEYVTGKKEVS